MKKWIIAGITTIILGVLAQQTCLHIWAVTPVCEGYTLELGEDVSRNPFDYLEGYDFIVERIQVDASEVDLKTPGTYQVSCTHGRDVFTYKIVIQDTIAPELTIKEGDFIFLRGKQYTVYDLVESATDLSGQVDVILVQDELERMDFVYKQNGQYEVAVKATDASGNETWKQVPIIVDTPPEIRGMQVFYLGTGYEQSREILAAGVMAEDETDGDLTAAMVIDTSEVDWNTAGTYQVAYTVEDQYGFDACNYADVYVMERDDLQEEIASHRINRFDYVIDGAYNLYDSGYYEADDVEFIMEQMEPALVRVTRSGTSSTFGSGFILEITDTQIIICTNRHVVSSHKKADIYFHEGSFAEGTVIGRDSNIDIALVSVELEDISRELLDTLMTVHVDAEYWKNLGNEEHISVCMRTINEKGKVWRDRSGKMAYKENNYGHVLDVMKKRGDMTVVDMKLYHGCSGSAILDGHGNLIAMATLILREPVNGSWIKTYCGVTLTKILDFYEKTMGQPLYGRAVEF